MTFRAAGCIQVAFFWRGQPDRRMDDPSSISGDPMTPAFRNAPGADPGPPPVRPPIYALLPRLAGASTRERMLAAFGALIAVAATAAIGAAGVGLDPSLPVLMAPAGASAVILFAIPASPLAQPWSIIGGNTISALVGVTVASLVDDVALAAGLACGLAIVGMSAVRCLHPPGGAVAVSAVIGGPAVAAAGYGFVLTPVALDAVVLVVIGIVFHRLCGRTYPHRPPPPAPNAVGTADPPPLQRTGFRSTDVEAALGKIGDTFDIAPDDLERVLREVERQALLRTHADLTCADLMSRDVVAIGPETDTATARTLLLRHGVRILPVVTADGRVAGIVGLRDLVGADAATPVGAALRPVAAVAADTPALSLTDAMTDGRTHAVVVADADGRLLGLVTQTDLLAALARRPQAAG